MHIHPDHVGGHPHHDQEPRSLDEVKTLLTYMINHNEHHANELADLLDALPQDARKKLMIAIGSFEAANVELQAVLECLNEIRK